MENMGREYSEYSLSKYLWNILCGDHALVK